LVGAKTVNGPGLSRTLTSLPAVTVVTRVERPGTETASSTMFVAVVAPQTAAARALVSCMTFFQGG
jgi:hypothetical protein